MRATLERAVLEVLWSTEEPLSVREVLGRVNATRDEPLAYTTVMTVLTRLVNKGSVVRHDGRRRHSYEAAAENEAALAVRRLLADFGEAAITHFLAQAAMDPAVGSRLLDLTGTPGPPSGVTTARGPVSDDQQAPRPPSWPDFYRGPATGEEALAPAEPPTDDWTRWIA